MSLIPQSDPAPTALSFQHLPLFAEYLLTHKLGEYADAERQLCIDLKLPILKSFQKLPEDDQKNVWFKSAKKFLSALAEKKSGSQTLHSIQNWFDEHFSFVNKFDITAEDITKSVFIRKKTFLQFLPEYSKDAAQMLQIIEEADAFLMEYELTISAAFWRLTEEKLQLHTHFINQVNNTLPGAVYIFDVQNFQNIYANDNFQNIIGYSSAELNQLGPQSLSVLVHEDDREVIETNLKNLLKAKDGEILSFKYRIKTKEGKYKWIRNFESVFKRNPDGEVTQLIAISLDVDAEKRTADQLKQREDQLLEAQEIANLGSFSWNLLTNEIHLSPQLFKILEAGSSSYEHYLSNVHPDDRGRVEAEIKASLHTGIFDSEYRYLGKEKEKILWSRGRVLYQDEQPIAMNGTVVDITDRVDLMHKISESEKLYQQAQAIAHLGNWSWDVATNAVFWSEELYRIFELNPEDTTVDFDLYISLLHPDERENILATINTALHTFESYDFIHRISLQNGTQKVLHSKGEVLLKDGKAVRLVGTAQDITEQYRAQQELEEKQNFITKITNAAPSIIASYHVHTGEYVFLSGGFEKLLGYEAAEVFGKGKSFIDKIVHPEDREAFTGVHEKTLMQANAHPLQKETVVEFTYRMKHKDGHYRWFHTYDTVFDRDAAGRVTHLLNISLDVTAQKEAAKKIEEQEYFIQQVAEASPTILYLFDVEQYSFAYVNREIFFVLGYTPEELTAMDASGIQSLYHPDDLMLLPERNGSDAKFQYHQSMMQYECRLKNKKGEWCWLLVREVVFKKDNEGKVLQILGAALDINKRKEMERTLLQNSFQLEQSNASLEEFAYVASHDLKEPLRKISTFGDRLVATQMERISDDGKIYLKKIVDASQRMQTMIDDLLSVSMITGNHSFQTHSLQAILEDARQAVEFKIEQKGAIIEAQSLPTANIIASQFRQLFQNLLSNSLKFVREGVQPVLRISYEYKTPSQLAHLNLPKAASYLMLQFRDNGIGFDNEFAGKIFQIFQRLHGRSEYEGTGIGLAICKKIVEHHSGVIYASGVPGEGATFTIILPA